MGGVCVLRIKTYTQGDGCNELKTPLEVDILAFQEPNHVSYITKKPKINTVCGCTLQNKEEKYHTINTLDGHSGIC